ncbi:MAG: YqaA family protein [Pseudomonadota bacterium]
MRRHPADVAAVIYLSVFGAAFLAATILPFYSEVLVVGAVLGGASPLLLWAVASAGNTLGAVLNAILGRLLPRERVGRLLGLKPEQFEKAEQWFQKYGQWSLLLAWAPIGGDALTVIAGILRVRWLPFVVLVFAGKAARYAVVIWLASRGAAA